MIKTFVKSTLILGVLAISAEAHHKSRNIEVKIINITSGSYFTPLLVSAHNKNTMLYSLGEKASDSLQAMAEGGNIALLSTELEEANANIVANPAEGLLAPGTNTTAMLKRTKKNKFLSIVAMILPSNDGFIALNKWKIPKKRGTYYVPLNAYDAGTEANNEIVNGGGEAGVLGIPADPGGKNGTGGRMGIDVMAEGFIHTHRGILGDTNPTGGESDLDSRIHRWLNPVAMAVITVK